MKFERIEWARPNPVEWHRWFAWFPVQVDSVCYTYFTAVTPAAVRRAGTLRQYRWLEVVERKGTFTSASSAYLDWKYRAAAR